MSTESKVDSKTEKKRRQWPVVRKIEGRKLPWLVDGRIDRKGPRYFFATATDADTKADLLRVGRLNTGNEGASMSPRLRADAIEAETRLRAVGATLMEAVEFFLRNARPSGGERTVSAIIAEFLSSKKTAGRSGAYLDIQKYVLGVFTADFGERPVHLMTGPEIEAWMESKKWTMRTRLNYFSDLRNLMGFAVRKGYRATNPLFTIDKPTVDRKKPGILTPEQASTLLVTCYDKDPDMLPAVAIGLFAGARTSELEQMEWKHVDFEDGTIEIPEEGKTGARYIKMTDNLRAWLLPYAKETGHIAPQKSFDYHLGERRKAAKIEQWPKNAMRHSFGSYHYSHHGNAPLTAAELGHEGSTRTLFKHYRALAKPKAAVAYWSIMPAVSADIVPMPKAAGAGC